jgi:predicted DNA binding CopG/RHH family protein
VVAVDQGGQAFILTVRDMTDAEKDLPQEGTIIITERDKQLPRPAAELEQLADYYESHDTSTEMEHGTWVEPQPMATTSLRLPADVISQLKRQAQARHVRYTTYVRSILERAGSGTLPPDISDITERLELIQQAVTNGRGTGNQKMA